MSSCLSQGKDLTGGLFYEFCTWSVKDNNPVSITLNTQPESLVAVVVTFNRLEKLRVVLNSLLAAPSTELTGVVVVDNASTDGTSDWLASQADPRLFVQSETENLGGAGGFEAGLREARARFDPDWCVVMDDDARPDQPAFSRFHALDKTGWDAILAAVVTNDGDICDMNRPARNPLWHGRKLLDEKRLSLHLADSAFADTAPVQHVDGGSFVGLFLSRRAFDLCGLPDRRFVYAEDILYTVGLTRAGGRIGFAPIVRFIHDSDTFTRSPRDFSQGWKVYYYYRNLLFLYRMTTGWLFWPGLLLLVPRWCLRSLSLKHGRVQYLKRMFHAVFDGVFQRLPEPPYGPFYRARPS